MEFRSLEEQGRYQLDDIYKMDFLDGMDKIYGTNDVLVASSIFNLTIYQSYSVRWLEAS